jgi:hypothetical protein
MSLVTLSNAEIVKRMRLGLVTAPTEDMSDQEDKEEWNEFESSDEEKESQLQEDAPPKYTFSVHRRSSIDLNKVSDNYHDSQSGIESLAVSDRDGTFMRGSTGSVGSMDRSSIRIGSSKDLLGIVNDVIAERTDDDASTVDGDADITEG